MSSLAPLVPPPPPPLSAINHAANNTRNANNNCCSSTNAIAQFTPEQCLWSLNDVELQVACYKARVCLHRPPHKCQYRKIRGITQVGPTCGLVAISMLMNGNPSANQLLQSAKQNQFTNNGEMFSAQHMLLLLSDTIFSRASSGESIKCEIYEGPLNTDEIKAQLRTGACVLVAYDSDYNHEPCLRSGHSAHWALLIGYLIDDAGEFFVLSRHGKSRNIATWSLDKLSASNANLNEFAQPKNYPHQDFMLPFGGIAGELGLRQRAIIVQGLPQELIIFS